MCIPVIDFSKLELTTPQSTTEWESVKSQFKKAIEEYGCFMAIFDKPPLEFHKSFFNELEDLHSLPSETKLRIKSETPYASYAVPSPGRPDVITIDLANVDRFCTTLWPDGKPSFSKTLHSFSNQLMELEKITKRLVLEMFGVEKYLHELLENTKYSMRVLKYEAVSPSCNNEAAEVKLQTHSDKSTITILSQNHVDALEVQSNDGQWITVHFSPNSFLILFGDTLHAWSNGRIRLTVHRVKASGHKEARHSAGLFSSFKPGYVIKAPDELVDTQHPLLFKPFEHTDFVKFLATHHDPASLAALNKYCGV